MSLSGREAAAAPLPPPPAAPASTASSDSPRRLDESSAGGGDGVDPPSTSDQLTGTAVFSVARRILEGSHAVPTRLKILLDRAMEGIPAEERRLILTTCGWDLQDYLRGYKLKV